MKKWVCLAAIMICTIFLQACSCDHSWSNATCTTPVTCSACGEQAGEPLGHVWQEATCTTPKTCSVCHSIEGTAIGHAWQAATCATSKTCSACQAVEGAPLEHVWQTATCTIPKTCSACQATEGAANGHNWQAATCTTPKTCSVCHVTEGSANDHNWQVATCTEPKICSICHATEGVANGHNWQAAACTTPKTCSVCHVTEGAANGHNWQAATCTTPKTCSVCKKTEGSALGHLFRDGKCSVCSELDPTYPSKLTAQEISNKCSSSVFYIETYSFNGALRGSGSGFFISPDGLAITNYHVVANTCMLEITTTSGEKYTDIKIIDVNEENDLALLRVTGQSFSCLEIGNSNNLAQGQTIYAIGSPIGLQNTMTQGLVSNPKRQIAGKSTNYIQISAQITNGSSGGALIDEYGKVVGVTSAGFSSASADLNLAVPTSYLDTLDKTSTADYWCWTDSFYPGLDYALDFGTFSGVRIVDTQYTPNGASYVYDIFDFHAVGSDDASTRYAYTLIYYEKALKHYGFTKIHESENSFVCENATEWVSVTWLFDSSELVVCAEAKTQYYTQFPALPDAGWYFGGLPDVYNAYKIENSIMYGYHVAEYYSENSYRNLLQWYLFLLEDEGFKLVGSWDDAHLLEGHKLSVVCSLRNGVLSIDVAKL